MRKFREKGKRADFRNRRTIGPAVLAAGLILLSVFFAAIPQEKVYAAGGSRAASQSFVTDDFSVSLAYGIGGNFRVGAELPVYVTLESLQGDFEGKIRLVVPQTDYSDTAGVAYEQDLLLTAGSAKQVEFAVKNPYSSNYFYLQIEDADGRLMMDQILAVSLSNQEQPLVGILSDDGTALTYFNSALVNTGYFTGNAMILQLDGDSMPDSEAGLDALSFLVINSFDTSSLSRDQQQAILDWVDAGGALILGTGPDAKQTLSMFSSDLLNIQAEGYGSGHIAVFGYDPEAYGFSYTDTDGIWKLSLEGGETVNDVLTEDGLIWHKTYGSGNITVCAFNLGMEPVNSWTYKDKMAESLLSETADGYTDRRMALINYGDEYYSDISAKSIYQAGQPDFAVVMLILMLFAAAFPVTYLFLKKLDRRELVWLVFPAEAFVFTAILLMSQAKLQIYDPVESSVTVLSYGENGENDSNKVFVSLLMPDTGWTQIQFVPELTHMKQVNDYSYDYSFSYSLADTVDRAAADYDMVVKEGADGYQLALKNDEHFESASVSFDTETAPDVNGMLTMDLDKTIKGLSGSLTNTSDYDLRGLCLLYADYIISVGDIPAGESVELADENRKQLFSFYDLSFGLDADDPLYTFLTNTYDTLYYNGISDRLRENYNTTIAFAYVDRWDVDYITNPEVKEYNAAILEVEAEIPYSDYPDAVTGSLFSWADDDDGNWDPNDGEMYALTAEPTVFLPDSVVDLYALIRAEDGDAMYGPTDNTTIYAWNYEAETYDRLFTDGSTESWEEGCPYIKDHEMKLQFKCSTEYDDYAPFITFVGGDSKNAGN